MKIFIQVNDYAYAFDCEPQTLISTFTKPLQQKSGIPPNFYYVYNGRYLMHDRTLSDYKVQNQSTIRVYWRHCGGGGGPITVIFNQLTQPINKKFSQKAPDYRLIDVGLNLQGQCNNEKCRAYKERVWANKGLGKFNMNKQVVNSHCPLCKTQLIKVDNLGIYNCSMKVQGKIKNDSQLFVKQYHIKDNKKFLTFENGDQTKRQWLYLELEVKGLGWFW